MIVLIFICLVLFYFSFIHKRSYNKTDHVKYDKNTKLNRDAKIVNFSSKLVGLSGEKTIEVEVEFDDGFKYIAHGAHVENINMFTSQLSLTNDMKINIIQNANAAHEKAIRFQEKEA